jgi:hypothetical protein
LLIFSATHVPNGGLHLLFFGTMNNGSFLQKW